MYKVKTLNKTRHLHMKAMNHDIHSLFLHIVSRYFTLFVEYTANCMNFRTLSYLSFGSFIMK